MEKVSLLNARFIKNSKWKLFSFVSLNEWNAKGKFQHENSTDKEADSEAPCEAVVDAEGVAHMRETFSEKQIQKGKVQTMFTSLLVLVISTFSEPTRKQLKEWINFSFCRLFSWRANFPFHTFLLYYAVEMGPDAICKWHTSHAHSLPVVFHFFEQLLCIISVWRVKANCSSLDCTHLSVNFGRSDEAGREQMKLLQFESNLMTLM